jgi:hypothetical protein
MRVAALVVLSALLVACGSVSPGGNPSSSSYPSVSPSAETTPTPSASPSPSPSPEPTPSPVASPSPSPVACAPLQGGTSARATIIDVRVGSHPGYDRLVVEFTGGLPEYKLVAQDPSTFVGPFSGLPISVAGSAGMHLFLYHQDIPPSYQHGTNLKPEYSVLKQVVVMADFEGQADIAIGLGRAACPAVSTLTGPYRLVIDFPT